MRCAMRDRPTRRDAAGARALAPPRGTRASASRRSAALALVVLLFAVPSSPAARCCRTCSSSSPCWRSRNTGTCSPALPGWSRSASRPSSGSAPTRCSPAILMRASTRCRRSCSAGLVAGARRPADGARRVPPARRLFRHRHLGRRRGVPAGPGAGQVAGRRHRHLAADRCRRRDARPRGGRASCSRVRGAGGARHRRLLAGARCSPLARSCWSTALLRSRHGLALSAIRDAEAAAESVGVDVFRTKLLGLRADRLRHRHGRRADLSAEGRASRRTPPSRVLDWTAYVIFIVVIGGIGSIEGPIVGVLVFYLLQDHLAAFGPWYLMLLGGLAILLMLFAPSGVWGVISHTFDISLFPVRRQIDRAGRQGEAERRRGVRRNRGFFREWGRERKRGIMVTEFGPQILVAGRRQIRRHRAALRLCCGPYLGLGEKRPPSKPRGRAARAQRLPDACNAISTCQNCDKLADFIASCEHRCIAALSGV